MSSRDVMEASEAKSFAEVLDEANKMMLRVGPLTPRPRASLASYRDLTDI